VTPEEKRTSDIAMLISSIFFLGFLIWLWFAWSLISNIVMWILFAWVFLNAHEEAQHESEIAEKNRRIEKLQRQIYSS
jgi:cobalamin biosynthesis protein CobD/CbiB